MTHTEKNTARCITYNLVEMSGKLMQTDSGIACVYQTVLVTFSRDPHTFLSIR